MCYVVSFGRVVKRQIRSLSRQKRDNEQEVNWTGCSAKHCFCRHDFASFSPRQLVQPSSDCAISPTNWVKIAHTESCRLMAVFTVASVRRVGVNLLYSLKRKGHLAFVPCLQWQHRVKECEIWVEDRSDRSNTNNTAELMEKEKGNFPSIYLRASLEHFTRFTPCVTPRKVASAFGPQKLRRMYFG